MPKVTIVVPVYNTEGKLLERCVESILRQTYVDFEAILVDDGSTEECAESVRRSLTVWHNRIFVCT